MRKLTLCSAILAALMPVQGYSLGLGEIELNSALNQELDAHVEVLSAEPEDAEQLIVKLASREAFQRAGIDRPYLLTQIKFKAVVQDGKPFIKIYTQKPIREPFLSFLLEIDWPEGHLLREYTLLLDPPVYTGGNVAPAQTASAADTGRPFIDPADSSTAQSAPQQFAQQQDSRPAHSSYQAPATVQSSAATTAPIVIESEDSKRRVTYQPVAQYQEVSGEYRVQQNDTLWSIANRMRPDSSVSVEQMMLALVRENPEAFIKENINGVKRGYILRMPDRSTITALDRQEALAQAREHATLWREYRQALSGAAPASSLEADQVEGGDATGVVADEPMADGQLSIVSASEADGSDTAAAGQDPNAEQQLKRLQSELSLAREALESERLEKEELRTRLAELEQRVQGVLQMDDSELAKLQKDIKGAQPEEQPAPVVAEEPVQEEVTPEAMPTEEVLTEEQVLSEEQVTEPTTEEAPMTDESMVDGTVVEEGVTPAEPPAEDAVFVDETAEQPAPMEESAVMEEPVQPAEVVPPFAQQKPKSTVEKLLEDPKTIGIAGVALLLVMALVYFVVRRLRGKKDDEEWSALDEGELGELDGSTEDDLTVQTQAMDADSTAEMPADESADFDDTQIDADIGDISKDLEDTVISLEQEEAAEEDQRDDVIAEADVYLAYGIYQQAEELLKNAIDQNPDRDDYRMKLLETHFAGKDSDAFSALAGEVKQRKGDDKSFWDRVVVMGRELCPENALFSDGGDVSIPDFDADDLLPKKPQTTDLELDAGEGGAAPDLDLSFDEEPVAESDDEATQILSEPLDLGEVSTDEGGEAESTEESELEFDLGDFEEELEEASDSIVEDEEDSLDIDEDFSLDFEASDLGFEEETEDETEAVAEPAAELDADLDLGVDLDDMEAAAPVSDDTMASLDAGLEMDMDMDDLDIDMDVSTEEPVSEDLEVDLDMGEPASDELEVDLDMGDVAEAATEPEVELDMGDISLDDGDDFDISELSEEVDEVSTKLDLARAYIDMGDSEGAKSILEEVKAEGNDEQQQQAEELLKQAS